MLLNIATNIVTVLLPNCTAEKASAIPSPLRMDTRLSAVVTGSSNYIKNKHGFILSTLTL